MRKLLTAGVIAALLGPSVAAAQNDPLAPTGRWTAYTAGRAATPPMGWSTWNAFATDIDEDKILGSAKQIVDSGLAAKGYRYINIDDGWALRRRMPDGRMIIRDDKFPSARTGGDAPSFKPFTDKLHAMGLKAGIYSDLGRNTCSEAYSPTDDDLPKGTVLEREVGIYGRIDQDIALYFKDWGFDFIKVDGCGLRDYGPQSERVRSGKFRALGPFLDSGAVTRTDIPTIQAMFRQINVALARENPDGDYLLSLCVWGAANVRAWGKDYGGISRTSDDISPAWGRLLVNYDTTVTRSLYAHPGSWNDPDMLHIGAGDFDADHLTEARSHFALWAMLNAPLLIGTDLRKTPKALLDIFGNADIIALNQDPAGNQATLAHDSSDLQILVKTLASGDKAVAIFNRGSVDYDVDLSAAHLKFRDDAPIELTDLWSQQRTSFTKRAKLHVKPRQTLIFRAHGARALQGGYYLSEQPGSVNPAVDGVLEPTPDPSIFRTAAGWGGTSGAGDRPSYAGWGGARADSAPYGQVLHVAGKPFAAGIGILANSRLEVRNAGAKRFTAMVGVDDSASDKAGAVTFAVYGDGKLLATSKPVKWGMAAQPISAPVAGVKLIELVARGPRGANQRLPVTWGEAALLER
ncbi:NPCBM/NEW2 domain-containing protein [Caulobacter sp. 602-1]|uniref:NPCBM/NEW2 domain-containing protein n=1 Tax=Caulobacter sp. 602-1 TaxID=2492472 RepID=UPI000F63F59E|nr:NPCBM/NEW2 domain-containing protein [Caulobacter sp. 602-1]RRN64726.1 alpha-galactosidase [Caulobacter sp. 602-1]